MTKLNPLSRAAATAAAVPGACLLALAWPAAAGAAAAAKGAGENTPLNLAPAPSGAHSSGSGASIVRTIVGLAIVIAVIWGLSWVLRQVKSGREPRSSSAGLTSIAALTLSSGRSVHLVRAGSDYLLLGSAEHGVIPIHRYTEEEASEAGLLDVIDAPSSARRALPRGPVSRRPLPGRPANAAGHDPMSMPSPGPGSSLVDRLRELTVRR
jgi:flagellar protein FliO/FliZ